MTFIALTIVSGTSEAVNYINVAHLVSFRPLTHLEVAQREKNNSHLPDAANTIMSTSDEDHALYVKEDVNAIRAALEAVGIQVGL